MQDTEVKGEKAEEGRAQLTASESAEAKHTAAVAVQVAHKRFDQGRKATASCTVLNRQLCHHLNMQVDSAVILGIIQPLCGKKT